MTTTATCPQCCGDLQLRDDSTSDAFDLWLVCEDNPNHEWKLTHPDLEEVAE